MLFCPEKVSVFKGSGIHCTASVMAGNTDCSDMQRFVAMHITQTQSQLVATRAKANGLTQGLIVKGILCAWRRRQCAWAHRSGGDPVTAINVLCSGTNSRTSCQQQRENGAQKQTTIHDHTFFVLLFYCFMASQHLHVLHRQRVSPGVVEIKGQHNPGVRFYHGFVFALIAQSTEQVTYHVDARLFLVVCMHHYPR